MGRKTEGYAGDAMYEKSHECGIMRKMRMQPVHLFPGSLFIQHEHMHKVNGLKETLPAVTGGVALVDRSLDRDIQERADVSFQVPSSDGSVLMQALRER